MKTLLLLVLIACIIESIILCGLEGYAYAQNYDPVNVPRGVTIYQPPPITGGIGYVAYPGGFNYIWSPGGNVPDTIIGIGQPPAYGYDPYDD